MKIKRGEFVVILGGLKAGKTSLLKALLNEMTYIPQDEIDRVGGKKIILNEEELKLMRKNIYVTDMQFKGETPIKIASHIIYVE